jgi:hypothetical protein
MPEAKPGPQESRDAAGETQKAYWAPQQQTQSLVIRKPVRIEAMETRSVDAIPIPNHFDARELARDEGPCLFRV